MIPGDYKSLIDKLIKATQEKKITWTKTSGPNEYQTIIGSGAITTDRWVVDNYGEVDFVILNENGEQIDYISAIQGEPDYTCLSDLHQAAKRSYLKLDETIKEISDKLDDLLLFG